MGNHPNISYNVFPKQGRDLGKRVRVAFHYDFKHSVYGTIVRDDTDAPYLAIIKLDDGRFIFIN